MSGFRSLAPSHEHDHSSGSSPAKPGGLAGESSTSGGGTSGGASGGASEETGPAGVGEGDGGRRRRNARNVSLMACTECRHARQKCDGTRPDPCGRCLQRKLACLYEPHAKTHKDDLIREIETLRGENTNLLDQNKEITEVATDLEHRNSGLQEISDWQKKILDTISSNGHEKEIFIRLRAGNSHQSIADWLSQLDPISDSLSQLPASKRRLMDVVQTIERRKHDFSYTITPDASSMQWTKVSSSPRLIKHLLELYFTWVHPLHMLFSELDFRQDFRMHRQTYCSSSLVNAICAMSCHLLDSEVGDEAIGHGDASTLREGFMDEARASLTVDNFRQMTSIQTFAIMYLVDLSSGKARSAAGYLRSAVDNLKLNSGNQQSDEAMELSWWAIQSLNTFCMGITYQPMHAAEIPLSVTFDHVREDRDDAVWRFYRRVHDDRELPTRPSNAIMTACEESKLFRVIHESLSLYCSSRGKATALGIIEGYKRYLNWKEDLPLPIKNIDINDEPLPHVLYLHVLYNTAIVQHFSPLLYCRLFANEDMGRLRRLVVFHAQAGIDILEHSNRLYSSRFQLPLMSFCILHLSDALVRHSPSDPPASEMVQFCLQTLKQSRTGFAICGPLQELFCQTAIQCKVALPANLDDLMQPHQDFGVDDILDACTRLEYTQPLDQVLRRIDPSVAEDWPYYWQRLIIAPEGQSRRPSTSDRFSIHSLLNG